MGVRRPPRGDVLAVQPEETHFVRKLRRDVLKDEERADVLRVDQDVVRVFGHEDTAPERFGELDRLDGKIVGGPPFAGTCPKKRFVAVNRHEPAKRVLTGSVETSRKRRR